MLILWRYSSSGSLNLTPAAALCWGCVWLLVACSGFKRGNNRSSRTLYSKSFYTLSQLNSSLKGDPEASDLHPLQPEAAAAHAATSAADRSSSKQGWPN